MECPRAVCIPPSRKALTKARDKIRHFNRPSRSFMPIVPMIAESNRWQTGWVNYFRIKLLRKPYMGNLYVRFDEGEGSAKSRPSLLYCSDPMKSEESIARDSRLAPFSKKWSVPELFASRHSIAQHRGGKSKHLAKKCWRMSGSVAILGIDEKSGGIAGGE